MAISERYQEAEKGRAWHPGEGPTERGEPADEMSRPWSEHLEGAEWQAPDPQSTLAPETLTDLGERIALLAGQISAATYELLVMLREFDEGGGWGSGFRSCAHWLVWRLGLDLGAAREKVRVARALGGLPLLAESMRRGEISYSKVRALTRIATPATEQELLIFARAGTASHVEKLVRGMRRVDRLERGEQARRQHEARSFFTASDEEGMVVVRARLAPEAAAVLLRAIDAGVEKLYGPRAAQPAAPSLDGAPVGDPLAESPGRWESDLGAATSGVPAGAPAPAGSGGAAAQQAREPVGRRVEPGTADPGTAAEQTSLVQRRADALILVAESALAGGLDPGTRGDRYQVVVHVDAEALPEGSESGASCLADGSHVSAETSRRLACDGSLVAMLHGADGRALAVGRRTRTISPGLRRALEHRDRTCRFPGCSASLCDAHHVKHWADGGETNLSNTVLLCRFHHRALHEDGFSMALEPSGEARFYRPDGRPLPQAPPMPLAPTWPAAGGEVGGPVAALTARLLAQGVAVDARESLPAWTGGSVEYNRAIEWLLGPGAGRDDTTEAVLHHLQLSTEEIVS